MLIRPSIRLTVLPPALPYEERFRMAARAGFEGVELEAGSVRQAEVREAAAATGIAIHSVHTLANWHAPLSSGDPQRLATGIRATVAALAEAHALGAETLQLVPGRVEAGTSYSEAYRRSQAVIRREILPVAGQFGIVLGIENVWNGFLLGPLEYVRYIDELESPLVKAYLDVGNVIFGHPEDWIEIAGTRIVKLHLKDFRFEEHKGRFRYAKIGDGDVDWPRVRQMLERTGFSGWGTFAQAEHIQGRLAARIYRAAASPPRVLRKLPGARPLLARVNRILARRLLDDVMTRHRRHLVGQG